MSKCSSSTALMMSVSPPQAAAFPMMPASQSFTGHSPRGESRPSSPRCAKGTSVAGAEPRSAGFRSAGLRSAGLRSAGLRSAGLSGCAVAGGKGQGQGEGPAAAAASPPVSSGKKPNPHGGAVDDKGRPSKLGGALANVSVDGAEQ